MKTLLSYLFYIVCFWAALPLQAQTRRALVIGLGQQADVAWNKINGDQDVPYVVEMLQAAHYSSIKTCVNQDATKAGIVSAFEELAASCESGDVVYVHYSGHGQQIRDVSQDEDDELDESWIPYDAYRSPCRQDRGEKHLSDDEVNRYLQTIQRQIGKSGRLLVVIDACHSGDATRGPGDETVRGVSEIFDALKAFFTPSTPSAPSSRKSVVRYDEPWITLSACESAQVNIEMNKPKVGKLTYALYQQTRQGNRLSNEDFFKQLRKFVNGHTTSRPQRPVMTGATSSYNLTDILR